MRLPWSPYVEAVKILNDAQKLCWERIGLPHICGLTFAEENEMDSPHFEDIMKKIGRIVPYRVHYGHEKYLRINLGNENIVSSGNELENDINQKSLDHAGWFSRCLELFNGNEGSPKNLASPALMTLKQNKSFWPKVVANEGLFEYWCLNTHIKGFLDKHENGVGRFWEIVKVIVELIKFRDATRLPVIITEAGNGQSHLALTKPDVALLFWIHHFVFGNRLAAVLFYDSGLIQYHNGYELLK